MNSNLRKNIKRITALCMMLCMLAGCLEFAVRDVKAATGMSIGWSSASLDLKGAGSGTVTVSPQVANNSGFVAFRLEIKYDPAKLDLTEAEGGDVLGTAGTLTYKNYESGRTVFFWYANDDSSNVTADGSLLKLSFTVKTTGTHSLTCVSGDFASADLNDLSVKLSGGSILAYDSVNASSGGAASDGSAADDSRTESGNAISGNQESEIQPAAKGSVLTCGKNTCKVNSSAAATVTWTGSSAKTAVITVPDTIRVKGVTYKVTKISAGALKNNTTVKKLVIGANVEKIAAKSFSACSSLKTIVITGDKLTKSGLKSCLAGSKVTTVKLKGKALSKYSKYKSYLAKSNSGKTVTVKK